MPKVEFLTSCLSHVFGLCFWCCSVVCLCSQVDVSQYRISLHLKYSNNTWCIFFNSHHQWKQLWVLKNITAWLCGWAETQDTFGPLRQSMLCGTPRHHITLTARRKWLANIRREISYAREHLVQCQEHWWNQSPTVLRWKLFFLCPGNKF